MESEPLVDVLIKANVRCPRAILVAVEMYANGMTPEEAVQSSDIDPQYAEIAKVIVAGKWSWHKIAPMLKKMKPADAKPLRAVISGFGRNRLLTDTENCDRIAILLRDLALYQAYEAGVDLSALVAVLSKYCQFTK